MQKTMLVIKHMGNALRVRDLESGKIHSIKSPDAYDVKELDTIILKIEKEWTFKKTLYTSGIILSRTFISMMMQIPKNRFLLNFTNCRNILTF